MPDADRVNNPAPSDPAPATEPPARRWALRPRDCVLAALFAALLAGGIFYWRIQPTRAERDAAACVPEVIAVLEAGDADTYLAQHDYSRYYARLRSRAADRDRQQLVARFDQWGPPLLDDLRRTRTHRPETVRELNSDVLVTYTFADGATITLRYVEALGRWLVATNRI